MHDKKYPSLGMTLMISEEMHILQQKLISDGYTINNTKHTGVFAVWDNHPDITPEKKINGFTSELTIKRPDGTEMFYRRITPDRSDVSIEQLKVWYTQLLNQELFFAENN